MPLVGNKLFTFATCSELLAHYEQTVSLYRYNWSYFSFSSNACYFALGMYAFRIAREIGGNSTVIRLGIPVFTSPLFLPEVTYCLVEIPAIRYGKQVSA